MSSRNKKIAAAFAVALAVSAIVIWRMARQPATAGTSDHTAARLEKVEATLPPDLIKVEITPDLPIRERLVVLVGENHASVRAQIELFKVLSALQKAGIVDAVLVEGSNGEISQSDFANLVGRKSGETDQAKFWQEQLEWGKVAGCEAFALLNPSIPAVGVEDMVAKVEHSNSLTVEGVMTTADQSERAVRVASEAVEDLKKGDPSGAGGGRLASLLAAVKTAAEEQKTVAKTFVQNAQKYLAAQVESARLEPQRKEASALMEKLKPVFPTLEKQSKLVDEHNSLVRKANAPGGQADFSITRQINSLKVQIEQIDKKLLPHTADLKRLGELNKPFRELNTNSEAGNAALKKPTADLKTADRKFQDCYFELANEIEKEARKQGRPIAKVQTFFRDDFDLLMKRDLDRPEPKRDVRDREMAVNVEQYFTKSRKTSVVLVVGYAHLKGVAKQLSERGMSVIGGGLNSNKSDIEPWEQRAWADRQARSGGIYTPGDKKLKEISRLLNPLWKENEVARIDLFNRIASPTTALKPSFSGMVDGGAIYEKVIPGRDVGLHMFDSPFDRNADVGEHLADRGPVPGRPGKYYQTFDRETAREQVKQMSDAQTSFVYYYRTIENGKPAYRLSAAGKDLSLPDFEATPPPGTSASARPKRVVLFGEPDAVLEEGTLATSALWSRLRRSGGGGKKPPTNPSAPAAAEGDNSSWFRPGADPKLGAVEVYRTINPRRAKEKIDVLSTQDPRFLGEVTVLKAGQLDRLPFTPTRGDFAHTVVIVARNVAEFRTELAKASREKRLVNKQVALVMCGDAFAETAAIRETLLAEGAIVVWTPDRQITTNGADKLVSFVKLTVAGYADGKRPVSLDQVMNDSMMQWQKAAPSDPDLKALEQSGSWVLGTQKEMGDNKG
jgi:hypothetical protein